MSHDILYDIKERRGGGRGDVRAGGAGPAGRGCGRGGSDGLAGSWGSDAEDIKLPSWYIPKTEIS